MERCAQTVILLTLSLLVVTSGHRNDHASPPGVPPKGKKKKIGDWLESEREMDGNESGGW